LRKVKILAIADGRNGPGIAAEAARRTTGWRSTSAQSPSFPQIRQGGGRRAWPGHKRHVLKRGAERVARSPPGDGQAQRLETSLGVGSAQGRCGRRPGADPAKRTNPETISATGTKNPLRRWGERMGGPKGPRPGNGRAQRRVNQLSTRMAQPLFLFFGCANVDGE